MNIKYTWIITREGQRCRLVHNFLNAHYISEWRLLTSAGRIPTAFVPTDLEITENKKLHNEKEEL